MKVVLPLLILLSLTACSKNSLPHLLTEDTSVIRFDANTVTHTWIQQIPIDTNDFLVAELLQYTPTHWNSTQPVPGFYLSGGPWAETPSSKTGTSYDNFMILVNATVVTPGTYPYVVGAHAEQSGSVNFATAGWETLVSDTVTITSVHSRFINGTFSATFTDNGGTRAPLHITNGIFRNAVFHREAGQE